MVWLKQNRNSKGWDLHAHREFPRKFESTNLSREIGCTGTGGQPPALSPESGHREAMAASAAPASFGCLFGRGGLADACAGAHLRVPEFDVQASRKVSMHENPTVSSEMPQSRRDIWGFLFCLRPRHLRVPRRTACAEHELEIIMYNHM